MSTSESGCGAGAVATWLMTMSPQPGQRRQLSLGAERPGGGGVSQLKVNVSASPAWEAELDGGVNAFLPSARALKCCEFLNSE